MEGLAGEYSGIRHNPKTKKGGFAILSKPALFCHPKINLGFI